MMPNPWECSFLNPSPRSTTLAAANLMPPARLIDVMLLPRPSSWQVRLHNKCEEYAQSFGQDGERRDACLRPGKSASASRPVWPCVGSAKLSNESTAQFCAAPSHAKPARVG